MTSCSVDGRQTEAHGIPTCLLGTGHTVAPLRSSFYAQPKEQERGVRLSVCLSVTTMSAATASIADVSRTAFTNKDERNKSGQTQGQCRPMPLPALGTQRIIQGNGTTVGTVLSLQCPAKHRLVGGELMCVMDTNSTHWVGENYCKPLTPYEDYGFRVAVLASIVSSAVIFFMSVAFITCCLLDCIKEDERKKHERESDSMWQWEEQAQHQEDDRSRYNHKGRNNNNNNNSQEKVSLWDTRNPAMCDNMRPCRCHQQDAYGPCGPPPPLSNLPGYDYNQLLLPRTPESAQIPGPPEYSGPPQSSCQTTSPGLVQISAVGPGVVWQYGGQQSTFSGVKPSNTDETNTRSMNPAKEFNIRIISV